MDNRGGAGNKAGTILQQVERSVRSPLDYLVDHVVDYTQDMPKALLMADDDVKEANDYFLTQTVIGVGKPGTEKNKKKMKFGMALCIFIMIHHILCEFILVIYNYPSRDLKIMFAYKSIE